MKPPSNVGCLSIAECCDSASIELLGTATRAVTQCKIAHRVERRCFANSVAKRSQTLPSANQSLSGGGGVPTRALDFRQEKIAKRGGALIPRFCSHRFQQRERAGVVIAHMQKQCASFSSVSAPRFICRRAEKLFRPNVILVRFVKRAELNREIASCKREPCA